MPTPPFVNRDHPQMGPYPQMTNESTTPKTVGIEFKQTEDDDKGRNKAQKIKLKTITTKRVETILVGILNLLKNEINEFLLELKAKCHKFSERSGSTTKTKLNSFHRPHGNVIRSIFCRKKGYRKNSDKVNIFKIDSLTNRPKILSQINQSEKRSICNRATLYRSKNVPVSILTLRNRKICWKNSLINSIKYLYNIKKISIENNNLPSSVSTKQHDSGNNEKNASINGTKTYLSKKRTQEISNTSSSEDRGSKNQNVDSISQSNEQQFVEGVVSNSRELKVTSDFGCQTTNFTHFQHEMVHIPLKQVSEVHLCMKRKRTRNQSSVKNKKKSSPNQVGPKPQRKTKPPIEVEKCITGIHQNGQCSFRNMIKSSKSETEINNLASKTNQLSNYKLTIREYSLSRRKKVDQEITTINKRQSFETKSKKSSKSLSNETDDSAILSQYNNVCSNSYYKTSVTCRPALINKKKPRQRKKENARELEENMADEEADKVSKDASNTTSETSTTVTANPSEAAIQEKEDSDKPVDDTIEQTESQVAFSTENQKSTADLPVEADSTDPPEVESSKTDEEGASSKTDEEGASSKTDEEAPSSSVLDEKDQDTHSQRLLLKLVPVEAAPTSTETNSQSEVELEEQPEVEAEVQPELPVEVQPEEQPEVQPEVIPELQPEEQPEVQPEVQPEKDKEVPPCAVGTKIDSSNRKPKRPSAANDRKDKDISFNCKCKGCKRDVCRSRRDQCGGGVCEKGRRDCGTCGQKVNKCQVCSSSKKQIVRKCDENNLEHKLILRNCGYRFNKEENMPYVNEKKDCVRRVGNNCKKEKPGGNGCGNCKYDPCAISKSPMCAKYLENNSNGGKCGGSCRIDACSNCKMQRFENDKFDLFCWCRNCSLKESLKKMFCIRLPSPTCSETNHNQKKRNSVSCNCNDTCTDSCNDVYKNM